MKYALPLLWQLLALITGQWLRPMRKKECRKCTSDDCPGCLSCSCDCKCQERGVANTIFNKRNIYCTLTLLLMFFTVTIAAINVFPTAEFINNWIHCKGNYQNICYTLKFAEDKINVSTNTDDPFIVLRDTSNDRRKAS